MTSEIRYARSIGGRFEKSYSGPISLFNIIQILMSIATRISSSFNTTLSGINCGLSNLGCWSKRNLFTSSKKSSQSCTSVGLTLVEFFDVVHFEEYVTGGGIQDNASSKLRTRNEYALILRRRNDEKLLDCNMAILRWHGYVPREVSLGNISKSFLLLVVRLGVWDCLRDRRDRQGFSPSIAWVRQPLHHEKFYVFSSL